MRRLLILPVCLGLVSGCDAPRAPSSRITVLGTSAPHVDPPYGGGVLRLTEAGVGPLNARTSFSAEAIAALFPEAEVRELRSTDEDNAFQDIMVRQKGFAIRIQRDPVQPVINRILIGGDDVRGPNGERSMTPGEPIAFAPEQCRVGPATRVLTAVCRRTGDSHVSLTYTVGDFAPTPVSDAPLVELAAHGFLTHMTWDRRPPV